MTQFVDPADEAGPARPLECLDHGPGAWFLFRCGEALYLDARYSYSALIDDSALIRLNAHEVDRQRQAGPPYLDDLAQRIHNSAPYLGTSKFYPRDLYRSASAALWRAEVRAAIDRFRGSVDRAP